jgi:chromosome segregation ATPase
MGCTECTHDEMLEAAMAELGRIHEDLLKLEAERDAALERLNRIADEPFDTPEEEAELARRVEMADEEYGRICTRIDEVEGDFERARAEADEDLFGADDDHGYTDERLSVEDAALIWLSNGMDEDYTCGYSESELRRAAQSS